MIAGTAINDVRSASDASAGLLQTLAAVHCGKAFGNRMSIRFRDHHVTPLAFLSAANGLCGGAQLRAVCELCGCAL